MQHQLPPDPRNRAECFRYGDSLDDSTHEINADLAYHRLEIVNVVFFGPLGAPDRRWVLIDAGVIGAAGIIAGAAKERFGPASRPAAIVLTHSHFDHVGALESLADLWETPIYAHVLEVPFLNGTSAYPLPDPRVGVELMAALTPLYPRRPIDVSRWLHTLPGDGEVPYMPGWRWLHTPGHSPGHVSLWREADRTLIAGDAFITTRHETAYAVATQRPEMHGPPLYFTSDWRSARASVERLAALEPELIVTGHGPAMRGTEMRAALHQLARDFDHVAMPEHGQYDDDLESFESEEYVY